MAVVCNVGVGHADELQFYIQYMICKTFHNIYLVI